MRKTIDIAKKKNWQGIADDIRDAIGDGRLKSGDALQGEQALAEKYNAGLYSIRSALNSLKKEGVLYSVPKHGVFVGKHPSVCAESSAATYSVSGPENLQEMSHTEGNVVHYVTRGSLEPQRAIYENIARSYSRTSISSKLEIIYHHGTPAELHPKGDVYEYGSQSKFCFSGVHFVDFSKYFNHIVRLPDKMYNATSVPLFHSMPLLIYNSDLLKKMGFGLPCYSTYEEQMAFLDEVTNYVALQGNYCMPGTTQNMILKCGNMRKELYKDIIGFKVTAVAARRKYFDTLLEMTRYWRKYHISYPGRTAQIESEFSAGKSPIFFGLSSHFVRFTATELPFELGASVMYSHDNTIDNDLGLVSIDMNSPNLVEAARAVDYIQNPEFQKNFAAIGYMPVLDSMRSEMPFHNLERMRLELAPPLIFSSPEEYYISINIINVELWNVVLFDKSIDDAIDSIFSFSRSYLQMKLDQAAIDMQAHKSDVYM